MDKGVEIQIEIEKNKVDDAGNTNDISALSAVVSAGTGVTGTFLTTDPFTVTVTNGIITAIR
jgi:hypothetical protein